MVIHKSGTGIRGLDELTGGGLPTGRPTLVSGGAGCGKTLLSMGFLVHGALHCGETGVFMAFEETVADLVANAVSLGVDLDKMIASGQIVIDSVRIERAEIEQSGDYDLEGLFIRLGHAIDKVGAKRVVLDTLEALFSDLPNPTVVRAELRRLFRWLKDRGVTTILTGERGSDPIALTRQGLEEYVSDCVIVLDNRVVDMISCRRLRVVKYRGSAHGTNEYPFLIDESGISVAPITSVGLQHDVSNERVPTGVPDLDEMFGGLGYYRGSSVLVSGTSGTGKSSLAAHFAAESCRRGERVIYFSFEESPSQIKRNMRSIGIDLKPYANAGLLHFHSTRPTFAGLEMHLTVMLREIERFDPQVVVVDPLNSFVTSSNTADVKSLMLRLIDSLKLRGITGFYVRLSSSHGKFEHEDVEISSLMDTWLLVRDMETGGERNRGLFIMKSRGMWHSNQIREFSLTSRGIELRVAYIGAAGVLTGSARVTQEAQEQAALLRTNQAIQLKQDELTRKRLAMEAQIVAIRAEFAIHETVSLTEISQAQASGVTLIQDRHDMAKSRKVTVE